MTTINKHLTFLTFDKSASTKYLGVNTSLILIGINIVIIFVGNSGNFSRTSKSVFGKFGTPSCYFMKYAVVSVGNETEQSFEFHLKGFHLLPNSTHRSVSRLIFSSYGKLNLYR